MATTHSADSDSVEPTGSVFLSHRVVTSFPQYEQQIRLILRGYGLLGFLDGTLTAPPRFVQSPDGALVTNPSASIFDQQDNLLTSWLLSTISSSFLSLFTDVRTAGDVWIMANNLFAVDTTAKQSQLRHELYSLQKAILLTGLSSKFEAIVSHASLSAMLLPFQRLVDTLIECEARQIRGAMVVLSLVRTGESWNVRIKSLSMVKIGGSLVKIGGLKFGQIKNDVAGPNLNYGPYGRNDFGIGRRSLGPQFGGDSLGHPYGGPASRPCGPSGSTVHEAPWRTKPRACVFSVDSSSYDSFQFVGIPPKLPELHASDYSDATTYDSNFNTTDSYVPLPVGSTSWCPDSRATHHVCRDTSDLHGSTPYSGKSSLLMSNGVSTNILSIGSAVIPTKQKLLHLFNALCVPSIRKNLLFVSKFATDNNVFFKFHPSYCVIKDIQTREILMRGQVRDGLYHFSVGSDSLLSSVPNAALHVCSLVDDVFSLWHKRLSYPVDNIVKNVLTNCQISFNKNHLDGVYVAYLWGPAAVPCEENLYYVSFIDMTSRFTWVYLISRKSQALECFGQFQKMVFTQFGKHIKQFQSDWGGEFRTFSSVLANQGIIHRVSCPHTSEQNSVAELRCISLIDCPLRFSTGRPHFKVYLVVHQLMIISECLDVVVFRTYVRLKVIVSRHVVFDENRFLFPLSSTSAKLPLNTTTYVPVVRSIIPNEVCPDPVSTTEDSINSPVHNGDRTQHDSSDMYSASQHSSHSRPAVQEEVPSTVTFPIKPPTIPLISTTNTHAMVTRSKAGIFKPKALCADKVEVEPCSVEEALAHPDWELSPLPLGRKAIGCKWLFRIKKNPDGTINRRKASLVGKGCSQVPGCDFKETFNPVVKPATIRTILSVAVTNGWSLRQVDVNNAFLNEDLTNEVFMQQPPGYEQFGPNDDSLFVRSSSDHTLYVLVYMDDIVITGNSSDVINCFVQQLHNKFALKDMGKLHYFLGIEVSRSSSGSLHLCQRKYIRELLARSSMTNAKSVHTPMVNSSLLSKDEGEPLAGPTEYRIIAGALQYIVLTRPDIAYTVNRVCQFMHAPTSLHMVALKRILRYLCGTISHGLLFRRSDRLSLVEAEYRSLAIAASDVTWLVSLLTELNLQSVDLPTVWCDNSSFVAVAANPVLHSKFKHVELDLFFIREKVASSELVVGEVPACDQVADILTKPLSVSAFTQFRHLLRVVPIEEAGLML
ncbi:hypothetical protein CXB51_015664 [Gossypium anomalum]|uniref:Integrase catalytic domain-containing protein n=1 Tax=Gossypium anomalum TaxID=47600 RepID=A0A8J6CYG6_9ROSI|nr:hypothetical protein CXB51_015664 [Gossypium anomalum]